MAAMPFAAHGFTLRPIDDLKLLLRTSGFDEPQHERVGEGAGPSISLWRNDQWATNWEESATGTLLITHVRAFARG